MTEGMIFSNFVKKNINGMSRAERIGRRWCILVLCVAMLPWITAQAADRIKDLASFQGVRSNQLIGYGLVVGLDGSGDRVRQTPFTQQSLTNMLSRLGVTVPQGTHMQVRNVAAVVVTARL